MELKILPGAVANMIAAGEVVTRPASVVKELMENALDAGADDVKVIIRDAGRTLIQVIDNGTGMRPDDAVLCFERHATSKLASAEDLNHILSFGFRGEALASIAAVAHVTLKTRREQDENGVEVEFAASEHLASREIACPKGANFAVRDLFYNIPARRKFLKSDKIELRHILEEFNRIALCYPDISFSLIHNDKDLCVLKKAQSLKFRIQHLLGSHTTDELTDIKADTSVARISGFVGKAEAARKTISHQYFFVNGRYFRSPYLGKAVLNAYEGLIPEGTSPSYFIWFEVDPASIDVNIHPTKTEIKFAEDTVLFQVLQACVRESLGRYGEAGSINFEEGTADLPLIGRKFEEYRPLSLPEQPLSQDYDPFASPGEKEKEPSPLPYGSWVDKHENYGRLFEEQTLPSSQLLILDGRYIAARSASGLMLVHIRRARERLLFERFLRIFNEGAHYAQTSLFPVQLQVGAQQVALFEEKAETLQALGFDIAPFGSDSIVVNAVPEGYSAEAGKVEVMISDLIRILSDESVSLGAAMASSMAERFALLGAAGSDALSSPYEAKALLDALLRAENPEFTASGRKIMIIEKLEDIDKKF